MKLRTQPRAPLKVEMQMTSMIDVVFQLLAFFIVSFKVIQQEGDLAIKMPASTLLGVAPPDFNSPLRVYLHATEGGELASIGLAGAQLTDAQALRAYIEQVAAASRERLQVDLVCDKGLHYEHAMAALTAVSGKRRGDEVLPLAGDVRLVSAE